MRNLYFHIYDMRMIILLFDCGYAVIDFVLYVFIS